MEARTTSRVVTPKSFLGLNTFCDLSTSATIGTVELTGLEMTRTKALGEYVATPFARSLTIPALILKRSIMLVLLSAGEKNRLESFRARTLAQLFFWGTIPFVEHRLG